jgi:hypothetical protein
MNLFLILIAWNIEWISKSQKDLDLKSHWIFFSFVWSESLRGHGLFTDTQFTDTQFTDSRFIDKTVHRQDISPTGQFTDSRFTDRTVHRQMRFKKITGFQHKLRQKICKSWKFLKINKIILIDSNINCFKNYLLTKRS